MKINELLPIGSVVLLREGKKRLMVFGVKQTDAETREDYDYIGVLYPEGNMGPGSQFFFNGDDIEKVFYVGYSDEERQEFIKKLDEFYSQQEA